MFSFIFLALLIVGCCADMPAVNPVVPCYGDECLEQMSSILQKQLLENTKQSDALKELTISMAKLEEAVRQDTDYNQSVISTLRSICEIVAVMLALFGLFKLDKIYKFMMILVGCFMHLGHMRVRAGDVPLHSLNNDEQ